MIKLINLLEVLSEFQHVTIQNSMGDTLVEGLMEDIYLDIIDNKKDIHDMKVLDIFSSVMDDSMMIEVDK